MDERQILNSNQNESSKPNEKNKNNQNFGEIKLDNFEDSLNLSNIGDDQCSIPKKEENIFAEDFSEDLDNIKEDEFSQRKMSDCSMQSDEFKNEEINIDVNTNTLSNNLKSKMVSEDISKKFTKKLTREELDNIPLPVFSCIYCSNLTIAVKHLSQEIITNKYLFQASIYDIEDINKLIIYQPLIDRDNKNEKLHDIIIKSTEYLFCSYNKENLQNFFSTKNYIDICNNELNNNKKYFTQKIEESIVKKKKDFYFKGIKNIPKNSINNRCLFNSTNSLINNCNALSGFVESIPVNINNYNYNYITNKNNNTNNSNLSLNFNSISLNNNEFGNLCKDAHTNNNNLLVSIVEHIENNNENQNELEDKEEFMDLLELDEEKEKEKKISKENISWDKNYYDIWNPDISDVEDNDNSENNDFVDNYFKCEVNDFKNNLLNNYNTNKKNSGNVFINKKRKFIKPNPKKRSSKNNNANNETEESQKNYKLKVNLLKTKTSNNSINFKLNQKSSISQVKSLGSTNSSTMINLDSDCKMKNSNNFSNIKDLSNNSQILIHVNTIQENENFSKIINNSSLLGNNKDVPNKSINFFHGLKINKIKPYRNFINVNNSCTFHPNINGTNNKFIKFNTNKNFFNTNHFNFEIHSNYDISNIINTNKYSKNKFKIFKEKKIKKRNKIEIIDIQKTININKTKKKINNINFSKTIYNINLSSSNSRIMPEIRFKTKTSINRLFNKTKVFSSNLIFSQNFTRNKKIIPFKNSSNTNIKTDKIKNRSIIYNCKKLNSPQISSRLKEKEKKSVDKIRQKIEELNKYIKNNRKGIGKTNLNNKIKTNKIKSGGVYTVSNNKNYNIISQSKNFFGKRKLCLSNSFFFKPKSKAIENNNSKKFLFLK